jgi:hypothetical protein
MNRVGTIVGVALRGHPVFGHLNSPKKSQP